jgi:uncharacterized YigZ family protein
MIKTIENSYLGEFKDANSKFLSFLIPVVDKSQAESELKQLKKGHPKANHVCFAYRIGFDEIIEKSSDDGEPSGTAGKPILNQLLSFQLSNCLLAVVRYFGGVKLGTSGLINAYKESSIAALSQAQFVYKEETILLKFKNIDLDCYNYFMLQIKKAGGQVIDSTFDQSYSITVRIEKSFQHYFSEFEIQ